MLAVMAPIEGIETTLKAESLDLVVANHNAPRQVILSGASKLRSPGPLRGVRSARDLDPHRSKSRPPSTAGLSWPTPRSGCTQAAPRTSEIAPGSTPVYANTTAGIYPADPNKARATLAEQLARPVRFVDLSPG